jgi:hypothetical protein
VGFLTQKIILHFLSYTNVCVIVSHSSTDSEFMNEIFEGSDQLIHGTRYTVCVHADYTTMLHETWTEELQEISACSDGIVIDLTPPTAGIVWIGSNRGTLYQVCTVICSCSTCGTIRITLVTHPYFPGHDGHSCIRICLYLLIYTCICKI